MHIFNSAFNFMDKIRGGCKGSKHHPSPPPPPPPLQGFDPSPTQRVIPLYYFEISILVTKPKKCLKASINTNFEGGGVLAEKMRLFFFPVFSKLCLRHRKFGHNRVFLVLWESSENQFGRPKKSRQNFLRY